MANIKVELSHEIIDGQPVTFVAPCDCTQITGLKAYYPSGSKVFTFKDAHGNDLTGIGNLFAAGAYIKAILDVTNGFAYIQNADTNAYLEKKFSQTLPAVESIDFPGCYYRMVNNVQEWLNPPLKDGVEYRTAERWRGMPVYQRYVPIGAYSAGQSSVSHGITNLTSCIGISLTDGDNNEVTQHPNVKGLYVTSEGIYLTVGEAQTFNATLKYTKS